MSVLQRTLKLVLATSLAISLAQLMNLSYASSAGIIAILSLLDTRKSSLKTAGQRLMSTLLALAVASLAFYSLGFSILSLAIFLVFYVPLAYRFHLQVGIAPSTVLVTHLLAEESFASQLLLNEMALFVIGAGVALLLNSYMPSKQKEIEAYHAIVETALKTILLRFNDFLLKGDGRNEGKLIKELDQSLGQALALVYLDRHNQVFRQTNYQVHYFEMRQSQTNILRQMANHINSCQLAASESLILAKLFEKTAQQLSQKNPAQDLLEEIEAIYQTVRARPLPKSRQEFETRAILFQLLRDMENFIQVKVDFYHNYKEEWLQD